MGFKKMKFKRTIGDVGFSLDTGRIERNMKEAQKQLNIMVTADSNQFVPMEQGALRNSVRYPQGIHGGEIAWNTPYAHYQYEGELYLDENGNSFAAKHERKYPSGKRLEQSTEMNALASDHWFERAKEGNLKKWEHQVKRIAGKG